jgi:hypothetical protein
MSGSAAHEIGIVNYPGAQMACILGLTDLFNIACTIALDQRRFGQTALRVTHWKPVDAFDANLSCVYDSAPRGSPQPRTLIIPPTMVNGGAAIAILAFLGQVVSRSPDATKLPVGNFVCPLMIFGLGVFCSALAAGLGFLSQLCFHDLHRPAIGNGFRISAVGTVIAGYVLFLAGLCEAGSAFIAAVA